MGKYMKKSKITGDIAVMELSQSTLGVRTRAKTLALQRLQRAPPPPPSSSPEVAPNPDTSSFSYLQLRSRRLEKPPPPFKQQQQKQQQPKESCRGRNGTPSPNPNLNRNQNPRASSRIRVNLVKSDSVGSVSLSRERKEVGVVGEECFSKNGKIVGGNQEFCDATEDGNDAGIEASFGENNLDFEGRDRSTRESTPCSLMRDLDTIGTPGSTTRQTSSTTTYRRRQNDMQRNIPTTHEMEEFFAYAEQQQQRLFIEKYNFDVVNDLPLPGRYEWVQVIP